MTFLATLLQSLVGYTAPLALLRVMRPLFARRDGDEPTADDETPPNVVGGLALLMMTGVAWVIIAGVVAGGALAMMLSGMKMEQPPQKAETDRLLLILGLIKTFFFVTTGLLSFVLAVFAFTDWPFFGSFRSIKGDYRPLDEAIAGRVKFVRGLYSLMGTLIVLGLSLLPLTSLIVALPAVSPNEAVLTDTVRPATSWFWRMFRRIFAIVAGLVVVIALLAVSIEATSLLGLPERGRVGPLMESVMGVAVYSVEDPKASFGDDYRQGEKAPKSSFSLQGTLTKERRQLLKDRGYDDTFIRWLCEPLHKRLPRVLIQHWPFVILFVYGFDVLLLLAVGKVPLAYNLRNLVVRRVISLMTALAFTVVVALVVVLLSFVNGMYDLNENSGIPGNVICLSDGSTDELFSNLGYGDVDNIPREKAVKGVDDSPLENPVTIKQVPGPDGKPQYLCSKEIFFTVNQTIPNPDGGVPKRRFLALRAMVDGEIAGLVHNAPLESGGKWFTSAAVETKNGKQYIQTVIGDGLANLLAQDLNKPRMEIGDTFQIGDTDWIVTGIMKSGGKTFGSEMWCQNTTLVTKPFGKDKYTTLVMRCEPDTRDAARAMAHHLQYRYDQQKLKAFGEQDYYLELTRSNETFLYWISMLAIVMAVGGVFGVMNTMFASIQARIKEVGVLRILGFKRWQILISFMFESLLIAFVGGLLGCALGFLANGTEATSTLGGQGGGGKRVLLTMVVDYQTVAAGMLFTLMMGRIGGLVPALSAMRMKVLDTLR
jgi:ABC-type lipoprotein release transport system permease subunit